MSYETSKTEEFFEKKKIKKLLFDDLKVETYPPLGTLGDLGYFGIFLSKTYPKHINRVIKGRKCVI